MVRSGASAAVSSAASSTRCRRSSGARSSDDLRAEGEPVPEPLSSRAYSDKFNLRVGPLLHRKLATEAAEEHLSLNQYILRRLTSAS